ncbi:MAG: hypothetical protein ACKO3V_06485, partial [Pirellula sp.]
MVTTRFDNSLVKKVRSARTFCLLVVVSMSMGLQAQEAKEIVIEQAAAGKAAAGIIADVQIVVAPAAAAPAAVKDDPKQAAK